MWSTSSFPFSFFLATTLWVFPSTMVRPAVVLYELVGRENPIISQSNRREKHRIWQNFCIHLWNFQQHLQNNATNFHNILNFVWYRSVQNLRYRIMLQNKYSLARIVLDTAANEPFKVCGCLTSQLQNMNLARFRLHCWRACRSLRWGLLPWTSKKACSVFRKRQTRCGPRTGPFPEMAITSSSSATRGPD